MFTCDVWKQRLKEVGYPDDYPYIWSCLAGNSLVWIVMFAFIMLLYLIIISVKMLNLTMRDRRLIILVIAWCGSSIMITINFLDTLYQYIAYAIVEGFKFTLLFQIFEYFTYKASKLLPKRKKLLAIARVFFFSNIVILIGLFFIGIYEFPRIINDTHTGLKEVPVTIIVAIMVFQMIPMLLCGFFYVILNIIKGQIDAQSNEVPTLVKLKQDLVVKRLFRIICMVFVFTLLAIFFFIIEVSNPDHTTMEAFGRSHYVLNGLDYFVPRFTSYNVPYLIVIYLFWVSPKKAYRKSLGISMNPNNEILFTEDSNTLVMPSVSSS